MKTPRTHKSWAAEDAAHFITFTTQDRIRWFEQDAYCQIVADQLSFYSTHYNVTVLAYVIMPDHVHALIWPEGKKTFSDFIRGVKSFSAKLILDPKIPHINPTSPTTYPSRRMSDQKQRIWQPEFFDYLIFTREKLKEKIDYIVYNPVEDGLTEDPEDYKWLFVDQEKVGEFLSW